MNNKKEKRMAGDRMAFGAGNITGPGAERRQPEQVNVGNAMSQGQMMPQDLSAGYLNLAIPGSPLGPHGLMASGNLRGSQAAQEMMAAAYQQQIMPMQMRGQLPVGMMPQQQQRG